MTKAGVAGLIAKLDRAGRFVENALLIVVMVAMVFTAVSQVVMREVFSTGIIWAGELVRILVLWLAIIGAVAAARDDRHIRIDLLSQFLSYRAFAATRVVVDLFAAAVSAVIAVYLWRYLQIEIELEFEVLGGLPAFPAHVIAPIGFALLSYRFVLLAAAKALTVFRPPPASEDSE